MKKKSTILLLDDSPTSLIITKNFLQEKNYEVLTANNQKQALDLLNSKIIDLMTIDWEMPEENGLDFIRTLRSGWKYFDLPIIVLTGRDNPDDVIIAMNAGCDDFISKEEPLELLEIRIHRLLFFLKRLDIERTNKKERCILLVDDSPIFLKTTKDFLETYNFEIIAVDSGQSALALLEHTTVDLMVVDWIMPQMDGLELIGKIRGNDLYREIPIIMLSGKDALDDITRAIEMGADDFITKDADLRILEKKIGVLLRIQEQYRRYTRQIINDKQKVEQLVAERTKDLEQALKELQATQAMLVHAEKMSSLGQLVAGVAHEINNPLGFIKSNIYTLKIDFDYLSKLLAKYQRYKPFLQQQSGFEEIENFEKEIELEYTLDEVDNFLANSQKGIQRISTIVLSLRNFSRLDEGEKKVVDIYEGIESTLMILNHHIKNRIEIKKELEPVPRIECAPGQMNQVFMNILMNAIQSIDGNGTITIQGYLENKYIVLKFIDTGKGISKDLLPKIFDPFFTTKSIGQGTGLGLSITYGIIQAHKGEISVDSEVGKGSTFTVKLPIQQI